MIAFFRNMRQRLVANNQFSKYILYALGEIFLVVIGILIALQINNWNEDRKYKAQEIKILDDLRNDILENVANLKEGIIELKISNERVSQVLEMYEQKIPYNDSLLPAFSKFLGQWDPDFTYAGFENLKSIGVNIISNTTLRKELIKLIEVEMDILDNSDMERVNQVNTTMVLPMTKKYFYRDFNNEKEQYQLIPSNYIAMINDPEFYNICTEVAYRQKRSIIRFTKFNTSAKVLISEIDAEIRSLE